MLILCIETSTSVCSAAVCKDGQVIAQRISREGANHARLLPVFIEELLHTPDGPLRPDAVALSAGPGSYTGLRIGTSTAKGLCYGWGVPLIAIPTLQVLCAAAKAQAVIGENDLLCPMIDARRMEVYTALFDARLHALTEVQAVVVNDSNAVTAGAGATVSDKRICYFGDGAAKCKEILAGELWTIIPDIVPEAQYMGVLAEEAAAAGNELQGNGIAYYEPFYLKEVVAAQSHVKGLK